MKKFKLYLFLLCVTGTYLHAQTRQVRGIVRDVQGPVAAATIQEKGFPTGGVATNLNGEFLITLKSTGNILVVRSVGYANKEVNVAGKTTIDITLQVSTQDLEDVVVVGYTTQKKLTSTGSASAVSGASIRENPSVSIQNTLAGRVTGFISQQRSGQPGVDGASFLVRGEGSLNGNNNPLIIVDNIEYSYEQFSRLDPNEVESVTILKDASQTAVYGIKGGNGVVVVTTRRGKSGKARITFRTDYGITQFSKIPTYLDSYNTAVLRNLAETNDNKYSVAPNPAFKPTWSDADLALFQNGLDPYGHPNVDWKEELFKDFAQQYKTSFDVSGGTEKAKYFVSLGYVNQGGSTKDYSKGQGYDGNFYNHRYNYRSNLDINVTKTLTLQLDAYGNIGEINTPSIFYNSTNGNKNDVFADFGSYLALAPYAYPIKNPDGSWGYSAYQRSLTGYVTPNIIQRLTFDGYNRNNENNMVLSTTATQKLDFLTKGLSAQGRVAYTNNYTASRGLTRQNLPSFIYTPANGTNPESYTPAFVDVYRLERLGTNYNANGPNNGTQRRVAAQGILTYDRTFNTAHHLNGLALYSLSSSNGGLATNNVNYLNYNFIPNNTLGYAGSFSYDYKSRYIAKFTGAYNGSSRFTGKKRYGFFPAGSAAYNIAEESFVKKHADFINQFKIRGSYGIVGNDQIGSTQSYTYLQSYINSGSFSFGQSNGTLSANTGIQEGTLPNADVTWDKEKQLDLGLDFGFFNSKITGSFDIFDYNRYDQLITRQTISAIFGQNLPPVNIGKTNRKGFDAELNFHSSIGNNFTYNLRGTFSNVKSKVVFRDEPSVIYPWQALTGHTINAEARYHFLGFYKDAADIAASPKPTLLARPGDTKYEDLNGDNIIDSRDQAVSDITNTPQNTFGLGGGLTFKGFSLNALFQGATKFNIRGFEEAIRPFSANLQAIHQQSWTPERGDNAKFPLLSTLRSISDPGSASDFWSIRGDYLRLRTAEFSYAIPARLVQKVKLQGARVYLSGNNLITWSKAFKLYALDPEATNNSDRQIYPPQRIYNFGFSVTF